MFYGKECWALATADVQRLKQNEHAMMYILDMQSKHQG